MLMAAPAIKGIDLFKIAGRSSSPPCQVTVRSLGSSPLPSSASSRVVSRLWSVLAVGDFLQAVECCASKRTPGGRRILPTLGGGGPGGKTKRTGMWSEGKETLYAYQMNRREGELL